MRLLTRTTRSVVATEAGTRILMSVGPKIDDIQQELVKTLRNQPSGSVRLTATEYAAEAILWPAASALIKEHPGIKVEINTDYGLVDIVSRRFNAGVSLIMPL